MHIKKKKRQSSQDCAEMRRILEVAPTRENSSIKGKHADGQNQQVLGGAPWC